MTQILAKDYSNRGALEEFVGQKYGRDTTPKSDVKIIGTQKELAALNLSGKTMVWGISCEETDALKIDGPPPEKVNRGKIHSYGLNNNLIKPPKNA